MDPFPFAAGRTTSLFLMAGERDSQAGEGAEALAHRDGNPAADATEASEYFEVLSMDSAPTVSTQPGVQAEDPTCEAVDHDNTLLPSWRANFRNGRHVATTACGARPQKDGSNSFDDIPQAFHAFGGFSSGGSSCQIDTERKPAHQQGVCRVLEPEFGRVEERKPGSALELALAEGVWLRGELRRSADELTAVRHSHDAATARLQEEIDRLRAEGHRSRYGDDTPASLRAPEPNTTPKGTLRDSHAFEVRSLRKALTDAKARITALSTERAPPAGQTEATAESVRLGRETRRLEAYLGLEPTNSSDDATARDRALRAIDELRTRNDELARLLSQAKRGEEELDTLRTEKSGWSLEMARLRDNLREANSKIFDADGSCGGAAKLKEELGALRCEKAGWSLEVAQLRDSLREANGKLRRWNQGTSPRAGDAAKLKEELEALRSEKAGWSLEVAQLRDNLREATGKLFDADRRWNQGTSPGAGDSAKLKEELGALRREKAGLNLEVVQLRGTLRANRCTSPRGPDASREQEVATLRKEKADLSLELKRLRDNLRLAAVKLLDSERRLFHATCHRVPAPHTPQVPPACPRTPPLGEGALSNAECAGSVNLRSPGLREAKLLVAEKTWNQGTSPRAGDTAKLKEELDALRREKAGLNLQVAQLRDNLREAHGKLLDADRRWNQGTAPRAGDAAKLKEELDTLRREKAGWSLEVAQLRDNLARASASGAERGLLERHLAAARTEAEALACLVREYEQQPPHDAAGAERLRLLLRERDEELRGCRQEAARAVAERDAARSDVVETRRGSEALACVVREYEQQASHTRAHLAATEKRLEGVEAGAAATERLQAERDELLRRNRELALAAAEKRLEDETRAAATERLQADHDVLLRRNQELALAATEKRLKDEAGAAATATERLQADHDVLLRGNREVALAATEKRLEDVEAGAAATERLQAEHDALLRRNRELALEVGHRRRRSAGCRDTASNTDAAARCPARDFAHGPHDEADLEITQARASLERALRDLEASEKTATGLRFECKILRRELSERSNRDGGRAETTARRPRETCRAELPEKAADAAQLRQQQEEKEEAAAGQSRLDPDGPLGQTRAKAAPAEPAGLSPPLQPGATSGRQNPGQERERSPEAEAADDDVLSLATSRTQAHPPEPGKPAPSSEPADDVTTILSCVSSATRPPSEHRDAGAKEPDFWPPAGGRRRCSSLGSASSGELFDEPADVRGMTGGCAGAAERELQAALAGKTALCEQLGGEVEAERAWAAACQESASRAERAVASLEAELRALAASGRNPRTLSTAVSSPSSLQDLQPATLSDDRNNVQTAMMANNDLRQALHPQTAEVSRHCESLSGAEALREGELQRKLEDATSDAAEQLSCLQGEIARLRIEASRAVELQRELENAQNDAAKQVSSLQRENERLQSDASQTAGFRRELEEAREDVERLSSLRRENECLRTEASRAIELQRDLEDGAAKQVSSLQRENERLQDDAFEFQRELEEAREAVGRLSSLQSENERLQAEASRAIELQHELEDAQSDFAKQVFYLQEENERLQVDVSEFQRELEEAREAMNCLSALQRENERLQTETSRAIELQRELEDAQNDTAKQVSHLQDENERLQTETSRAIQLQRELEDAQNDAAKQVSSLQRENERLQADALQTTEFRRELEGAREAVQQVSPLREDNERLQADLSERAELQRKLEEERSEAVRQLSSLQREHECLEAKASETAELQRELVSQRASSERLDRQLRDLQASLDEAAERSAGLEDRNEAQAAAGRAQALAMVDLQRRLDSERASCERLDKQVDQLQAARDDAARRIAGLLDENETLRQENEARCLDPTEELERRLNTERDTCERLSVQLGETQATRDEALQQVAGLERENNRLQQEMADTRDELQGRLVSEQESSERLDKQVDVLQEYCNEALEQVSVLEAENSRLQTAMADSGAELQRELNSERASCQQLRMRVDELQASCDGALEQVSVLERENERLRQAVDDADGTLQRELAAERASCEGLHRHVNDLQAAGNEARDRIAALERENEKLQLRNAAKLRKQAQETELQQEARPHGVAEGLPCTEGKNETFCSEAERHRAKPHGTAEGAQRASLEDGRHSQQQESLRTPRPQHCTAADLRARAGGGGSERRVQPQAFRGAQGAAESTRRTLAKGEGGDTEALRAKQARETELLLARIRGIGKGNATPDSSRVLVASRSPSVSEAPSSPLDVHAPQSIVKEQTRSVRSPHSSQPFSLESSSHSATHLCDGPSCPHPTQPTSLASSAPAYPIDSEHPPQAGLLSTQPNSFASSSTPSAPAGDVIKLHASGQPSPRDVPSSLRHPSRTDPKAGAVGDRLRPACVSSARAPVQPAPTPFHSPRDHASSRPAGAAPQGSGRTGSPNAFPANRMPGDPRSSFDRLLFHASGDSAPSAEDRPPCVHFDRGLPGGAGTSGDAALSEKSQQETVPSAADTPQYAHFDRVPGDAGTSGHAAFSEAWQQEAVSSRADTPQHAHFDRVLPGGAGTGGDSAPSEVAVSSAEDPPQCVHFDGGAGTSGDPAPKGGGSRQDTAEAPQGVMGLSSEGRVHSEFDSYAEAPQGVPGLSSEGRTHSEFDLCTEAPQGAMGLSSEGRTHSQFDSYAEASQGVTGLSSEGRAHSQFDSYAKAPQGAMGLSSEGRTHSEFALNAEAPQANATSPRRVSATVRHSQRTYEVGTVPGAHSGAGGSSLPTTKARSPGSIPTRFSLRSPLRKPSPGAPADRRGQPDTSAIGILVEKHVAAVVADQRRRGDRRDEFSGPAGKGATWSRKLETSAVDCLVEKHLSALVADHKWRANLSDDRNTRVEKHPGSFDDLRCGTSDSPGKKEAIQKQPGRSPLGSRGAPSFAGEGRRDDSRIERTQDVTKKEGVIQSQLEEGSAIGRLLGEHGGTTIADERRWTQQRATERAAERGDYEEFVRKRATEGTATVRRGSVSTVSTPVKATRDGQKPWIAEQDELGGGPQPPGRERSRGSLDGASVGTSNERAGGVRALARKVSLKHFGEVPEIAEVLAAALDGERERSRKLEGVNKRLEATRSSWEAEVSELKQDLGKERDRASALQQSLATVSSATKATRAQQSRLSLVVDATAALATAARRRAINAEMASQQSALELQLHRNYNASPYHSQPTTPPGSVWSDRLI